MYLIFCSAIVMKNPNATAKGHSDCHVRLGHRVHRGGHQRGTQGDFLYRKIIQQRNIYIYCKYNGPGRAMAAGENNEKEENREIRRKGIIRVKETHLSDLLTFDGAFV